MNRRLNLNTNVGGNQRYSFLPTPLEMHAPGHQDSVPPLPVESSTYETQQATTEHSQPTSTTAQETAQDFQEKPIISPYPSCPPPGEHPANYAPFADGIVPLEKQTPEVPVPQYSYGAPPNSPGLLPVKVNPEAIDETQKGHPIAVVPDENPLHPPQFPRSPPPIATVTAQPAASTDIVTYHKPGQISHPNQEINGRTWNHGLCDCSNIGTCCLGLLCPCILYGRTQYRLSMKSRKEDPTNLLGFEMCNGSCAAMALLCGCQCKCELYPQFVPMHCR